MNSSPKSNRQRSTSRTEAPSAAGQAARVEAITHRVAQAVQVRDGRNTARDIMAMIGRLEPRHLRAAHELGLAIIKALPSGRDSFDIECTISSPGDAIDSSIARVGLIFGVLFNLGQLISDTLPDYDLDRLQAEGGSFLDLTERGSSEDGQDLIGEAMLEAHFREESSVVYDRVRDFGLILLQHVANEARELLAAVDVERSDAAEAATEHSAPPEATDGV